MVNYFGFSKHGDEDIVWRFFSSNITFEEYISCLSLLNGTEAEKLELFKKNVEKIDLSNLIENSRQIDLVFRFMKRLKKGNFRKFKRGIRTYHQNIKESIETLLGFNYTHTRIHLLLNVHGWLQI